MSWLMQHTKVVASSIIAVLLALSVAWGASVSVTLNATVTSVSLANGNYQFVANGLSPDSGFVPSSPIIGVFANDSTNTNQTWTWNGTTLATVGAPAGTYMKDTGSGIGLVAAGSADTWQIHKVGSTSTYTMFDVTTGRYLGMNGSTSGAPGSLVEGALQTAWVANSSNDLAVASNGHYLNKNGVPFFFLGDTEWILNLRSDSDVTTILNDRAAKGFSVVQVMAVRSWNVNGSGDVSHDANGNLPFVGSDPTQLNAAYWARWHSIASQTATKGLHFLLVYGEPGTGTSNWNCTTGAQCYEYGRQVGVTFRDLSNVIFSNGQDSHASSNTALYRAMAEGVADGVNGVNSFNSSADYSTTMMTYHGQDDQIATLHQDLWLDFYGVEVYGNIASIYNEVNSMYNLGSPTKPGMILEGDYETFTYPDGLATPYRERLQVWNVAFAGGGGYTYGHNSNYLPSQAPSTYLNSVGAQGMQAFSTFMRARQWWNLVPHQAAIVSGAGSGETQKDAVQSVDGSECLVYYPDVEAVTIGMSCITSSNTVSASWFDPRNGNTQSIGSFANSGSQTLTPPNGWEDAVLVLQASGGGGPTPPAQASVANFNTCVVCIDFTAPTGGVFVNGAAVAGASGAVTSTWLDCAGASSPIFFHQSNGLNTGALPCPDIVNDGLGNPQVLRQWNGPLSSTNVNGMKLYNNGASTGIMAPTNNYMEATFIVPQFPNHGYIESIWLGGAGEIPTGVHNYLEFDAFEVNTNISSGAYASGAGSWINGHGDLGANWFGTFPPNYDSYDVTAQYLKVGQRITSDGASAYKCMWINDVFQNCLHMVPDNNSSNGFLTSQLSDATSRMQTYFILTGCIQSNCVPGTASDMVGYAKSFRMWSCSSWQTTACKTGSADPGGY